MRWIALNYGGLFPRVAAIMLAVSLCTAEEPWMAGRRAELITGLNTMEAEAAQLRSDIATLPGIRDNAIQMIQEAEASMAALKASTPKADRGFIYEAQMKAFKVKWGAGRLSLGDATTQLGNKKARLDQVSMQIQYTRELIRSLNTQMGKPEEHGIIYPKPPDPNAPFKNSDNYKPPDGANPTGKNNYVLPTGKGEQPGVGTTLPPWAANNGNNSSAAGGNPNQPPMPPPLPGGPGWSGNNSSSGTPPIVITPPDGGNSSSSGGGHGHNHSGGGDMKDPPPAKTACPCGSKCTCKCSSGCKKCT